MSATTWTAEAPTAPFAPSNVLALSARRLGYGLAFIAATATLYAGLLLAVLMSASIIQF